tara:strand:- start:2790 stop:2918 length:129 start_codon:yes stop_codon:yes gene_type:complete
MIRIIYKDGTYLDIDTSLKSATRFLISTLDIDKEKIEKVITV